MLMPLLLSCCYSSMQMMKNPLGCEFNRIGNLWHRKSPAYLVNLNKRKPSRNGKPLKEFSFKLNYQKEVYRAYFIFPFFYYFIDVVAGVES
jgi:hypothetical protein